MNKYTVMITIILFWLFLPLGMMLANLSGFLAIDTTILEKITSSDFNLFSLSGFGTFADFLFGLGKYTISNGIIAVPFIAIFFSALTIITIVTTVWFLRGD